MEKEFSTFRKSTFGGFNRKDVISYIEKMRNESFEYKKQVEETVKSLNEKIIELENAARLMEPDIAEADETEIDAVAAENMSDINDATKHLKSVADELCRSLGEFMEKLSRKGLFDKSEEIICQEESLASELEQEAEKSIVDSVLSSLSFLCEGKGEEKTYAQQQTVKNEKDTVSDILGGLSFLG